MVNAWVLYLLTVTERMKSSKWFCENYLVMLELNGSPRGWALCLCTEMRHVASECALICKLKEQKTFTELELLRTGEGCAWTHGLCPFCGLVGVHLCYYENSSSEYRADHHHTNWVFSIKLPLSLVLFEECSWLASFISMLDPMVYVSSPELWSLLLRCISFSQFGWYIHQKMD